MLAAGVLAFVPTWRAGDTDNVAVAAGDGVRDADPTLRAWPAPSAEARDRTERQLLELVGVHLGSGGDRAMIRVKNGESAIFRVGDEVFDGRQLVEIHATHVLLRNRGRTERLRMTGRSLRPRSALRRPVSGGFSSLGRFRC